MHPGDGWETNINQHGPIHTQMIRNKEDKENRIYAPFFHYNFNTDDPEVLLTIGRDCPVHSCLLHTQPSPYPLQPFTKKQCLLFHPKETHAPLVNYAVDLE